MSDLLVRTLKAVAGRGRDADDRQAARLFLGTDENGALIAETRGRLDAVRSVMSTDRFARSADDPDFGRGETLGKAVRSWASALPLLPATRGAIETAPDRRAVLSALFADPEFLSAVMGGRRFAFSPASFLPARDVSETEMKFVDRLLDRRSALIDSRWLQRWGLDGLDQAEALIRYGDLGWFSANPLFDADWYAERFNVQAKGWFERLQDYVETGEGEGRPPNPFVNPSAFLRAHGDLPAIVLQNRLDGWLEHLIARDVAERRSGASHFDADFYGSQVAAKTWAAHGSPFAHYVQEGWRLGRQPNPVFDELGYLRAHPEALRAVSAGAWPNAFAHFIQEGEAQGLRPSPFFDADAYLDCHPDLKQVKGLNPFWHYWSNGRREGRDMRDGVAAATGRVFRRRLPTQCDLIDNGRWRVHDLRPEAVLEAARGPVLPNLADAILDQRLDDEAARLVALKALTELGQAQARIEHGAEQHIHVGDVNRLYVSGYASLGPLTLKAVRTRSPDVRGGCEFFTHASLHEVDAVAWLGGAGARPQTGFLAWFAFSAADLSPGDRSLNLEFVFEGAEGVELVANAAIAVHVHPRPERSRSREPVQVAMASYNPPMEPFRAQVDSILANKGVHLVISDDASPKGGASLAQFADHPRVDIDVNRANTGFIINFERSLYMCSEHARTMLFSDQDDLWRPDKVDALLEALAPTGVVCAFSDMRGRYTLRE